MLVSNVILVTALFLACFAFEEKKQPWSSRVPRLSGDVYRPKKRQEDQGYVEQCRATNLWTRLGYVNVYAFLDASWEYSYRQAIMLKLLKKRLAKAGFSDIWFIVIAAPENLPEDKVENDMEIEAWREISMFETENLLISREKQFNDLIKDNEREMIFIQDTPELGIWQNFRASKDQIIVADRCGKLSYQVIVPWSILYFPYVKAAILSTYKDDPCGPCDIESTPMYKPTDYEEYYLMKTTTTNEKTSNNRDFGKQENSTDVESMNVTASFNKSINGNQNISIPFPSNVNINTNNTVTNLDTIAVTPIVETDTFYDYLESTTVESLEETTPTTFTKTESEGNLITVGSTIFSILNNSEIETTTFEELSQYEGTEDLTMNSTTESNRNADGTLLDNLFESNNNLFSTTSRIIDLETTIESGPEDYQEKLIVSSTDMGEREEISSVDYNGVLDDSKTYDTQVQENEGGLPIRILMRAPHLHRKDNTVKKYTYLILKTGSPDYHEHFGFEYSPAPIERHSSQQVTLQDEEPDGTAREKHGNPKLVEFINNQDEGPGFYGEVEDHWKNYEDTEYINESQTTNSNTDYDAVQNADKGSHVNGASDNEDSLPNPSNINENTSPTKFKIDIDQDSKNVQDITPFENDNSAKKEDVTNESTKEDKLQQKLIEHYSKLLPWTYYVLRK